MAPKALVSGGGVVTIQFRGFETVAAHFAAIGATVGPMTAAIVGIYASEIARVARELHLPHFDTGATYFSISAGERGIGGADVQILGGEAIASVGTVETYDPQTTPSPQARLLEFGFRHVNSDNRIIQYPFMLPAARSVGPEFASAMFRMIAIGAGQGALGVPAAVSGDTLFMRQLSSLRSGLYSNAKMLGDLNVIFGSSALGGLRSFEYGLARPLGDVQATMRGAIGTRITHRTIGRFSGAGISTSRSAILSGPSSSFSSGSQRIYNRFVGRSLGGGLRGAL